GATRRVEESTGTQSAKIGAEKLALRRRRGPEKWVGRRSGGGAGAIWMGGPRGPSASGEPLVASAPPTGGWARTAPAGGGRPFEARPRAACGRRAVTD